MHRVALLTFGLAPASNADHPLPAAGGGAAWGAGAVEDAPLPLGNPQRVAHTVALRPAPSCP